jgi:hypothetical protein
VIATAVLFVSFLVSTFAAFGYLTILGLHGFRDLFEVDLWVPSGVSPRKAAIRLVEFGLLSATLALVWLLLAFLEVL